MQKLFDVVAEDDDLLVINKPAGLVCHPTKGDEYSSLISRVRLYLGERSAPHMINRLDRETSGLVLVAKCLESAVYLRKLWESREVEKEYLALVHGHMPRGKKLICAPLGKDPASAVAIKDTVLPGGAEAETHVFPLRQLVYRGQALSIVRVLILTGRKHQIRIHLGYSGYPVVGDKLYGGDENIYLRFVQESITESDWLRLITRNQALHASRITIHWYGARRTFTCSPEPWFLDIAQAKGPSKTGL
jgi:23S rRNA pseudouridine1911/1915/1917 synthase